MMAALRPAQRLARPAHRLASGLARRLALVRQADFWLGELDPLWALGEIRARVAAIIDETADARTFVLEPNAGWRGHRAGQHTTVELEIDGVRVRRCYSISSAPGDPRPAITVKRARGGRVSGFLHERVSRGHLLRLSPAAGEFVLPEAAGGKLKLLFLTAGSGITPVMSMLRDREARGEAGDFVLVHHARSRSDVIFRDELEALAARHGGARVVLGLSDGALPDGPPGPGRFDEERFRRLVPDFAERTTFLCGPPALMARAERLWAAAGATANLRQERFAAPPAAAPAAGGPVRIGLVRSGRSFTAGAGTLLEQLEEGGARPASGCRMGICQTCRCRKRSGTVENLRTGAVSSAPDEDVQPCISAARSDLELWL